MELPATGPWVAHFGCKVLGNLKEPAPPAVMAAWDRKFGSRNEWRKKQKATDALAETLRKAAVEAGFSAITLWDTMRNGSDYWRPGNLLSKVASQMASPDPRIAVTFLKLDELCPPTDLLNDFRRDQGMAFAEYAHQYAEYLRKTPGLLQRAATRVMLKLAMGSLPAFYCTDPHIPDYVSPDQILRIPYRERSWMREMRSSGCHRVILAEEIVRFLLGNGLGTVTLCEVDPTFRRVYRREFRK